MSTVRGSYKWVISGVIDKTSSPEFASSIKLKLIGDILQVFPLSCDWLALIVGHPDLGPDIVLLSLTNYKCISGFQFFSSNQFAEKDSEKICKGKNNQLLFIDRNNAYLRFYNLSKTEVVNSSKLTFPVMSSKFQVVPEASHLYYFNNRLNYLVNLDGSTRSSIKYIGEDSGAYHTEPLSIALHARVNSSSIVLYHRINKELSYNYFPLIFIRTTSFINFSKNCFVELSPNSQYLSWVNVPNADVYNNKEKGQIAIYDLISKTESTRYIALEIFPLRKENYSLENNLYQWTTNNKIIFTASGGVYQFDPLDGKSECIKESKDNLLHARLLPNNEMLTLEKEEKLSTIQIYTNKAYSRVLRQSLPHGMRDLFPIIQAYTSPCENVSKHSLNDLVNNHLSNLEMRLNLSERAPKSLLNSLSKYYIKLSERLQAEINLFKFVSYKLLKLPVYREQLFEEASIAFKDSPHLSKLKQLLSTYEEQHGFTSAAKLT